MCVWLHHHPLHMLSPSWSTLRTEQHKVAGISTNIFDIWRLLKRFVSLNAKVA